MNEVVTVQAYTVTVDIHEFSKQTGEIQWLWYSTLKNVMNNVLKELPVTIATTTTGAVFWSPGGDGGTLSVIEGGAARALKFAVRTAEELAKEFESRSRDGFEIRVGIDKGQVHIALDLNGSPNVWGTAINNSHRIASTCAAGQLLASDGFIEELRNQTNTMNEYVDPNYLRTRRPQKRLAKHGQFFSVVNLYHEQKRVGRPVSGDAPTVADFEGPFSQMVASYRDYLNEVVRAGSGIWTLLLSRKLHELGRIADEELFNSYVAPVSFDGQHRDPNYPRDPFFSCFRAHDLDAVVRGGRFQHLARGEELRKVGDIGDALYAIARGRLEIYDSRGLVAIRDPGSIVGEMALIEPGYLGFCVNNPKRTARMVAGMEDDVTLFAIPYEAMRAANTSDAVLKALIQSYSEKQKENALRDAKCFRDLHPDERAFMRITGDLVGLPPGGEEWTDDGAADCLLVCCHGKITIERGTEKYVTSGQAGSSMGSVWLPGRTTDPVERRIRVTTAVASEFLVWRRSNWRDWLLAVPSRNRRGFIEYACDKKLESAAR